MSAENLELIRRGYEAFGRGDIGTVLGVLDPNIHWHIPGQRTQELAAGTFAIQVDDLLASAQRVAVLCTVSAQRHGQHWSATEVHVWRVANGRAVEFREYHGDQQAEDEFWSR